jgi:gamma-glutamyltranspeptidase / glutathione hydrolase
VARLAPFASRFARRAMVCAVDHHAAQAGLWLLRQGGTAADAAVGASAVLAVTTQHMCGMGGDLFALVHDPAAGGTVAALNASGRSGSGADPDRLRDRGLSEMPFRSDISVVPVPGCVDGWMALHARFGRLPLPRVLESAIAYADDGFPTTQLLAASSSTVAGIPGASDYAAATRPGAVMKRPGVARTLRAIAEGGRAAFYEGEFGEGLLELGPDEYARQDLAEPNADWVEPLQLDAWGARLWTVPPNSQGYLTLAGAWIADGLELPDSAEDPLWAHLLIEAARHAAYDRVDVLHEHADGAALLDVNRLRPRRDAVDPRRAADLGGPEASRARGTIALCVIDQEGMGVSLIQSNATGFGSGLVEPRTGVFLQNRGIDFSLVPGHPAEYGPRRRPPHTLSPALVTDRTTGGLRMVLGTMGGDTQPQILLQLLARILQGGEPVGEAIAAPRWGLEGGSGPSGFGTWAGGGDVAVSLEPGAPAGWRTGLEDRRHRVASVARSHGHAHAIVRHVDCLEGASDPRALAGDAAGY